MEIKNRTLWVLCAVASTLLAMERYLIVTHNFAMTDDCYFMLILFCPAIFLLSSRFKLKFKTNFRIREISVLIYVMHGCCERIIGYLLKILQFDYLGMNITKVLISFLIIIVFGHFLIYVKEKKTVRFLKYAF